MKILKYILFLLLLTFIGIAIYIAVQPDEYHVARTRTINAPISVVYNNVIDFKNWEDWSPWLEKNPNAIVKLGEQTEGVGGEYTWQDKDGSGTIKTLNAEKNVFIEQEMQFEDFSPSKIYWSFEANNNNTTNVTWSMKGSKLPFMFKAYTAFSGSMDKQVGPDYERGLEKLENTIISEMQRYSIEINGITEHSGGYYLYNSTSCKISELESKMAEMFPKIVNYAKENQINFAGAPFAYYHIWDKTNNATIFSCCVPTNEKIVSSESDVLTGQLTPFKALKVTLKGDYKNLTETWEKAFAYIPENDLEFMGNGPMLETYITDPEKEHNPANWITEIYIAVK